MLLSAVSVLVVAQLISEIPEGLMNNPVYIFFTFWMEKYYHSPAVATYPLMYNQLCGNRQNEKDGNVEETERRKLETCDIIVQHIGPVCVSRVELLRSITMISSYPQVRSDEIYCLHPICFAWLVVCYLLLLCIPPIIL